MTVTIGIDVGGTKIAGGVVDARGTILEQALAESPARDVEAMSVAITTMVRDLAGRHPVRAVGLSAAGFIDTARATVLFAPNLAWRDVPLRELIAEGTGLPTVLENDGNAAAWGEFVHGAGAGATDLLMIAVGTGVGGGLVLGGTLHRGGFGIAGELGHVRVVRDGLLCGCGRRGCLEQYGSGTALERAARASAESDPLAARDLLGQVDGDVHAITGPLVTSAALAGDAFSTGLLAELGTWLGEGAAQVAAVVDPDLIVIGGGVSAAGGLLLAPMRAAYAAHLSGDGRPVARIRVAALGNTAGLIGAADLAARAVGVGS